MAVEQTPNNLELTTTRHFTSWLAAQKVSLMFTTYEAGKLFSIGLQTDGRLSIFERTMPRCMGLYVTADAQTLYLSTLYQIWRFEQINRQEQNYQGFDGVYLPQSSSVTGDVDAHDVVLTEAGEVVFVNTLMSCLARTSDTHNFVPLWKPPFISKLAAEDRCHLNGLALREGRPQYVTCVGQADANDGWRQHRVSGGIVMDVSNDEVMADGLSMPHSPRFYKDRLWLLNSGEGEFGYLDSKSGKFETVAFCPGYARGMAFLGDYAVIGLSKPRENRAFTGLNLGEKLTSKKISPRCGLQIVNLKTGDVEHSLELSGIVSELYDVALLPGIARPMTIGFKSDEIEHILSIGQN
ncbi:MAG: TIGR03032 family protein [Pseudomonadales bacterium]|nr:TIGR03032 family protein [Pseudomonadales bacterium]MBO7005211.1 TIGR03032 family protein [Pseudomonadales bacterium]